ncbi:sulfotransferase [Amylibacter marinus]|uniref:Sulfotransferase n=1 Tax=Amylibacter marinus TaxID=1475483 RepID=A0ABQ5VXE4_9RHOB|nr:sulfotransferase domain-containing protein [Amylibacter marinus]GLQ35809.1 sulfotransferase [Amylibacter marinus]
MILLASYPKSGNTWVRSMLTHYLSDAGDMNINQLTLKQPFILRADFDEAVGVNSADLSMGALDNLRADFCRDYIADNSDEFAAKVHDIQRIAPNGRAVFPCDSVRGVVYLIRNPLNVAPSFANHLGFEIRRTIKVMNRPLFRLSGRIEFGHHLLPQQIGTWSENVTSWVDQRDIPVTVVRYEDLLADPVGNFARIVAALGRDVDADRIAQAAEYCAFDRLQRQEAASGFSEMNFAKNGFFAKGAARDYRAELSDAEIAQINADHGAVMRRFGYATD